MKARRGPRVQECCWKLVDENWAFLLLSAENFILLASVPEFLQSPLWVFLHNCFGGYNLHIIRIAHLKCTMQSFLVYPKICETITSYSVSSFLNTLKGNHIWFRYPPTIFPSPVPSPKSPSIYFPSVDFSTLDIPLWFWQTRRLFSLPPWKWEHHGTPQGPPAPPSASLVQNTEAADCHDTL